MVKPSVSVIGAGLMGSALVRQFVNQGYPTTVWNRSSAKLAPLSAAGAKAAGDVVEAIANADFVIANVTDYAASNPLLRTVAATKALRGKVLVQLSTGTPSEARAMAAWAREKEIQYLDGAIMVTPNLIGEPGCLVLYSGEAAVFEKYKTHLQAIGGEAVFLGEDPGQASTLDASLLVFLWSMMFGAQQAIAISQAEGLPLPVLAKFLQGSAGFMSTLAVDTIDRVDKGNFAPDQATLEICHASVRHIIAMCREHGIDDSVPAAFDGLFTKAVNAGHAQSDFSVGNRLMRPPVESTTSAHA